MKPLTYSQYCKNTMAHRNAGYMSSDNGGNYYVLYGKRYTPAAFNKKFPITGKIINANKTYKGESPDGKTNWITK